MEATNLLYRDPALYDLIQSDSTGAGMCQTLIEMYRPDARTLLDFGCGTGRDLEILAKRFECTGLDLQPGMVDYARQARPELDIRIGDMRTVRLRRCVDVVTCLGNSLAYVHDNNEIAQVFATFAAHAQRGSLLVLCSPVAPITSTEPMTATVDTPSGPATVTIRHEWDLRTQINTMHRHWVLTSGDEAQDEIRRRVLFPRELEQYAERAGFEVLDMIDSSGGRLAGPTAYTVARYT
ncbi:MULTISPECIES: trans-aconitate 2-methyltransferase [Streptomyces]|uniref:class I SAM-dependent methyltransferase n=1 Tax=Streptomyces TaxID=1883 RepID=UPI000E05F19C|nr:MULTISPECIES: methyltransferase domain-containing protein [Streptomyces]MBT3091062.1 methyltransferase domain-containing protein [Streptomyces sp. CYG21]MBT3098928.1 methyltransferase domain-containing protein [Streptomyces sp. CBG30]MBT3076865.1 methyltransferase domain-containing protein [Streptomyces sp. COG21]MBT3082182.1 methyltransferase domain-containing protein [Streptomyces sp. COG20]MBT3104151.1 methyltransferase domain-containing protein [Streptomyces sp. COG19]